MIRDAALRTIGSGGPSGVDATICILACKSFKESLHVSHLSIRQ